MCYCTHLPSFTGTHRLTQTSAQLILYHYTTAVSKKTLIAKYAQISNFKTQRSISGRGKGASSPYAHAHTGTRKTHFPPIKDLRLPHLNVRNSPSGGSRLGKGNFERQEAERVNSVSTPSVATSTIPILLQQQNTLHPPGARAPAAATHTRTPPRSGGPPPHPRCVTPRPGGSLSNCPDSPRDAAPQFAANSGLQPPHRAQGGGTGGSCTPTPPSPRPTHRPPVPGLPDAPHLRPPPAPGPPRPRPRGAPGSPPPPPVIDGSWWPMAPARPRPGVCRSPRPAPPARPGSPPSDPRLPPRGHRCDFCAVRAMAHKVHITTTTTTSPPQSLQNRNYFFLVGGGCSGEGCNKLHSGGRGREGGMPAAFYSGSANRAVPRTSPPPPEGFRVLEASGIRVSKRVLPPVKRRGETPPGNGRAERYPPYFCGVCRVPPPPSSTHPRVPPRREPRPPAGCSPLPPARWPQPAQCSPAYPPSPAAPPPAPTPEPAAGTPPAAPSPLPALQPPPPPGPTTTIPFPRPRSAAEGSGGTAWGRRAGQAGSAPPKKPPGLRGNAAAAAASPTRPDSTQRASGRSRRGEAGRAGRAASFILIIVCGRLAPPPPELLPATPPPPLSSMTRHL